MRDYLNRLRMQFQRFMIGRYGMDQFGRFLSSLLLALIIFNFLIPAALPSRILWALEWIVLVILYARMFSKNINKRYQENEAFLRRQFYVSEWWKKWKFRFQESRKYHIYRLQRRRGYGQKAWLYRALGRHGDIRRCYRITALSVSGQL